MSDVLKWVDRSGGSLGKELEVVKEVGGVPSGKTYPAGTTIETIISEMLSPTMNPTLIAPSCSINASLPNMLAVGDNVPSSTITVSLNRGSISPKYAADEPYRSGPATGYSLNITGASVDFDESGTGISFTIPSFTRVTKGDVTLTATANYAKGCQPQNSIGENYGSPLEAGMVSATRKVTFIIPFKYGVVDNKNDVDLNGMTVDLSTKKDKTYAFTTNNQYGVIAYDQSHGNLSKIFDQNNFDVTSDWEQGVSANYLYYIMKSPTTDSGAEYRFKF